MSLNLQPNELFEDKEEQNSAVQVGLKLKKSQAVTIPVIQVDDPLSLNSPISTSTRSKPRRSSASLDSAVKEQRVLGPLESQNEKPSTLLAQR